MGEVTCCMKKEQVHVVRYANLVGRTELELKRPIEIT